MTERLLWFSGKTLTALGAEDHTAHDLTNASAKLMDDVDDDDDDDDETGLGGDANMRPIPDIHVTPFDVPSFLYDPAIDQKTRARLIEQEMNEQVRARSG